MTQTNLDLGPHRTAPRSALFTGSRHEGLRALATFVPRSGRDYAASRNADRGPDSRTNVSMLSPYLRHRLITEHEVVEAVLARHSASAAEKFVQEVLWRTYWKGWLEMRPGVWQRYVSALASTEIGGGLAKAVAAAEGGTTGIDGFDDWARELVETGYLHNHARMWFASIWIFTLNLPWVLGADFFMRHLVDGDPASNTLSWRWVAGLQTAGKTYLATADNIGRYTEGRFAPKGLAKHAVALSEPPLDAPRPLAELTALDPRTPALLLITGEDMHPESMIGKSSAIAAALVVRASDPATGPHSVGFMGQAADDVAARIRTYYGCSVTIVDTLDIDTLMAAATAAKVKTVVTPYAPVGSTADTLATLARDTQSRGVALLRVRRSWDDGFWPYAKKGFFAFKEKIPVILAAEGLRG